MHYNFSIKGALKFLSWLPFLPQFFLDKTLSVQGCIEQIKLLGNVTRIDDVKFRLQKPYIKDRNFEFLAFCMARKIRTFVYTFPFMTACMIISQWKKPFLPIYKIEQFICVILSKNFTFLDKNNSIIKRNTCHFISAIK